MSVQLDLVAIHWLDAATTDGWESDEDAENEPHSVYTVGFLVRENSKVYVVASTSDHQGMNNARMNIPKGMVKSLIRFPVELPLKGIQRK